MSGKKILQKLGYIRNGKTEFLAYHKAKGKKCLEPVTSSGDSASSMKKPEMVWLGGFNSDMQGTKARAFEANSIEKGYNFLRFDYYGHGQSSGIFLQGTLSLWLENTLLMLEKETEGPQILIGSSMGGWIALLAALARPERIQGLFLIAPAPDFTETLMWEVMGEEIQKQLKTTGSYLRPCDYDDEPYEISMKLIEDGRKHLLLHDDRPLSLSMPVQIVQGLKDMDVPWAHALRLLDRFENENMSFHLIKNGDHRLSSPFHLQQLLQQFEGFLQQFKS